MRKYSFLLFFLIILPAIAFCQKTEQISGHAKTSGAKVNLINASVLIVRSADSIMIDHTRTNQQGFFSFSKIPNGKYFLIVGNNAQPTFVQLQPLADNRDPLNI